MPKFFRDEWHERVKQLQNLLEELKCPLKRDPVYWLTEFGLDHFQVPGAEIIPNEPIERQERFTQTERLEIAVKFGKPLDFAKLREEAKTCSKPRLKEIYQEVADEIMKAIAVLEPRLD